MESKYVTKALEIAEMLQNKAEVYGNQFETSEAMLKLVYPDGIAPHQYKDAAIFINIFDTIIRMTNSEYTQGFDYLAGYGIIGATINK